MFDMNLLWEHFVIVTLRKYFRKEQSSFSVTAQTTKYFWKPQDGYRTKIIPDILIKFNSKNFAVLDTKWKNLNGYNPSAEDLRQLFVYHEYFQAQKVALVYPGNNLSKTSGLYLHPSHGAETDKECSVLTLSVGNSIKDWQTFIGKELEEWLMHTQERTLPKLLTPTVSK
ncbi:hypothetical protein GCM10011405_20030 [Rufibacter glacialis]|nr:hypothetical protein GCM10011405_20030 [Rufibacter glacialis]